MKGGEPSGRPPSAQEDSDEVLMLRYRDGEEAAFETLYARHRGPLYRYLLRQVHQRSVAEELFQDVWLKLIRARGRYRPQARFATYLYRIAHNRLVDHLRRSHGALRQAGQNAQTQDPETLPARAMDGPEQRAGLDEQMGRLLDRVAALPQEQREAFVLREEAGLSVEQIAQASGVSPETAKSRLRYALAKLRRGLEPPP